MPEVQDFDDLPLFVDPIVDQDRRVHQLADVGAAGNWASDVRITSQQFQVIENCSSKMLGGSRKVSPGVLDNLLEIL
jgi:hypothetical protein